MAFAGDAHAVDLPVVDGKPIKLEVTETSIVSQRFAARPGELESDQGYFSFLNRLNAVLSWKKLTVGLRLDSSLYFLRPEDRDFDTAQLKSNAQSDGATRYRNAIYPAKVFVTYKTSSFEATVGDSYVQFGRGLVLSMRKVDELGIDTTMLGAKVIFQKDPFAFTLLAGVANPARVDEPTGRALFLPKPLARDGAIGPQPLFGSDRLVGAQMQVGRGLPVTLSTHGVILTKCAPYKYNDDGSVRDGFFDAPIGTCEDSAVSQFLDSLPKAAGPILRSKTTINVGQSLEIPNLWKHGNFYVEGAVQQHDPDPLNQKQTEGNAVFGALTNSAGPFTNVVEFKSYRNFFPLAAAVNVTKASSFGNIAYSAPPTAEVVTQDAEFGFFNACVTGGRDRLDYRVNDQVLFYGAFGFFVTRSESPGALCDRGGKSTADKPAEAINSVSDASLGGQINFDHDKSIAFFSITGRNDVKESGAVYYREIQAQYTLTKYIKGPVSFEVTGRHRLRQEESQNIRTESPNGVAWNEGEHYNALKVAPKWVFSQGIEYTTFIGLPTLYFNGGVLYKFTGQSNIRAYAGQNRGGLKCVSGICRFFPPYSGARVELTLRF